MNNHKHRTTAAILLMLIAAGMIIIFQIHPHMRDFEVNYTAGKRMRLGETLYRQEDEHYMFKYLPSAALLYVPLACLPLNTAKSIWFVLSLAALAGVVVLSRKLLPPGKKSWPWILTVFILAKFYLREIQLGQINAMVTAVLLAMLMMLKNNFLHIRRPSFAGFSWGLAVSMKPYSFIFFPYWVIKRYFILLAAGLAFILAAGFLPVYYYGFSGNLTVLQEWYATLSQSTPMLFSSQDNVSLVAFFTKLSGSPGRAIFPAAVVVLMLAGLVLAVIIKGRTLSQPAVLEGALLLTCIPLVSPLGWDYTFLSATLGIMMILYFFECYPLPVRILGGLNFAVIALSLYDLMGPQLYARFMNFSVLTIIFLILTGYLAYLRFKEIY